MIRRATVSPLLPLAAVAVLAHRPLRRAAVRAAVDVVTWGVEEIAEGTGPFVFAANHPSSLDGPLLRSVLEPVVGPVAVASDAAGLGRGAAGAVGLGAARVTLRAGRSVVVFAEAERADDGDLRGFGTAAARLAIEAGAPLVPVAIDGTFAALPPWRPLPRAGRPRVTVTFSRPIPAGASDEPAELAHRAEQAVQTAIDGTRGPWFAAHLAHAGSGEGDGAESHSGRARWRRIWGSTRTDARPARRRTWR
ncbi:lysophospholipid acyltransferase family protein [Labedella endophytica]|uniref:1-acyl-sn-glycerol-3-phosphate acyltransferase n=1 Tax=Labedella endophytica TaxID=1523160 RepID=A0A3S0XAN7_9MICO|nr:lysophospholipid acyltransferase family protein [Labedella endophytica]RUR00862.1 1-acyl-sn-glycerol-3-phosphate acyltransferase [Labedella endophytica]